MVKNIHSESRGRLSYRKGPAACSRSRGHAAPQAGRRGVFDWLGLPGRALALVLLALLGWARPGQGQAISWTGVSSATVTNLSGTTAMASNTYYNIRNAALDGSGNIIVVGEFAGQVTFGSTTLSTTIVGGNVVGANYIAKWSPSTSTWLWAYSGGTSSTAAYYNHVAVSGNSVYVVGSFTTSTVIGSTTLTSPGYNGLFLAKFTDNGSSLSNVWAKKCSTSSQQNSSGVNSVLSTCGVTVRGSNVYMAGRFVNDITVEGTAQLESQGNGNIFVAKFSDAGTAAWAVQTGGSTNDSPSDVKAGASGIYVAGSFSGSTTYGSTTFTNFGSSGNDICLIKFNDSNGSVGWARQEGGTAPDNGNRLFVDGSNVYMAGSFTGSTASIGGASITNGSANSNMFVAKYQDNGSSVAPQWGIGSTANGSANTVPADGLGVTGGMVYVAGSFNPTATIAGTNLTTASGGTDVYVARFTDNGTTVTNNGAISGGKAGSSGANDGSERLLINGSTLYLLGRTYAGATFGSVTLPSNGPYGLGFIATVNLPGAPPPAPSVALTSGTVTSGGTTSTSPVSFTATFSASVTGFAGTDVAVTGGAVTSGSFSGSGSTYTFTVTPSGAGAVSVTVPAGVAQNGSANNTASAAYTFTYSLPVTAAPTVSLPADGTANSSTTPAYSGTAVSGSTVTVYVDGVALSGAVTATGGSWSKVQPTALSQGSHNVKATAQASGASVSGFGNVNTFTVDNVVPTATITSGAGASGSTTSTTPIPFTVTFTEPVSNFVIGDVAVSGGTKSALTTVSSSQYTFTLTPSGAATYTVNVAAGVATDAAGNGNSAATQFSITYTPPTTAAPVVSSPAHNSSGTDTTPTYSGTAPNGSTVTVYVNGSSIGTVTANPGNGNWSKTQSPALPDGTYTVYATAQSSGQLVSASSNTNTFTIDNAAPTVTITSPAGGNGATTSTAPVPFTVTFSENVSGLAISEITVTGGTKSALTTVSASQYTFTVTPAGAATITVNLAANQANDAAGNGNTAAAQFSLVYTPAPTVTSLNPAAELPGLPVVITGTGFTAASSVTFGGVAASGVTFTSATSLTATVPGGAATGSAAVVVTTGGVPSVSSPAFSVLKVYDAVTSCLNTVGYAASGDGQWHYLLASNGQVVAALQDTRAALGTVTVSFQATGAASAVRQDGNGLRYLDRNFRVTASGGNAFTGQTINLRFYGLTSEFARLQAVQAGLTYGTLKATQYSGPNEDCQLVNNSRSGGETRTLSLTASTPGSVPWFVAQAAVADHFSEFYLTGSSQPLPVELLSFTAEARAAAVQLQWRTAQELNNARFEVERSLDGSRFETIGQVAGQGSSTRATDYRFLDNQLPKALSSREPVYYRLRQVDLDGAATLSAVRTVTLVPAAGRIGLELYPRPVQRAGQLHYLRRGQLTQEAELTVYSVTGKQLATHQVAAGAAGTISTKELPAGWYLLRLRQADGSTTTARFLVQ